MPNTEQEFTIPGGGIAYCNIPGSFLHVKDATAPFYLQPDSRERTVVNAGSRQRGRAFQVLKFTNKSATKTLRFKIVIGDGTEDSDDLFPLVPPTENDGLPDVTLANGDSTVVSGVDSNGNRRKHFTVYCKPSMTGRLQIYNNTSGKLIAIVGASSSGGGVREETDADILVKNLTGGAIQNYGDGADFCISQVFYQR